MDNPPVKISILHHSSYPFCEEQFQRMGNHFPYRAERGNKGYSAFLAKKTLDKRKRPTATKAKRPKRPVPSVTGCLLGLIHTYTLDTHLHLLLVSLFLIPILLDLATTNEQQPLSNYCLPSHFQHKVDDGTNSKCTSAWPTTSYRALQYIPGHFKSSHNTTGVERS